MKKLWGARFQKETDAVAEAFNSSIAVDGRMYAEDIAGSIAHASMLGRQGIIQAGESERIIDGLRGILADIESGKLEISPEAEDIHMFIESELTARIGDAGKRLHTARSRNDQVALDTRMYVLTRVKELERAVTALITTIIDISGANLETVMPGYTHLQRAQPVTLAHHLMAWAEMLRRDLTRLEDARHRMDQSPLGACALAGTTYPLDRQFTASELGLSGVMPNSLDAVSDRDFALETLSVLAILMTHLSRMSEEYILWCGLEFGFAMPDDAFSTGSSIMPQKKNPDIAELTRGKTGRVYGALITLLTVMKGLPLAYNKDMQEDKEAVFDALDTVALCLEVFTPMLASTRFNRERMERAVSDGFLNATDAADFLVRKGMPFREAYGIVGGLVALCSEKGLSLESLDMETLKGVCPLFDESYYECVQPHICVIKRGSEGGPAPEAVRAHIEKLKAFLENRK